MFPHAGTSYVSDSIAWSWLGVGGRGRGEQPGTRTLKAATQEASPGAKTTGLPLPHTIFTYDTLLWQYSC